MPKSNIYIYIVLMLIDLVGVIFSWPVIIISLHKSLIKWCIFFSWGVVRCFKSLFSICVNGFLLKYFLKKIYIKIFFLIIFNINTLKLFLKNNFLKRCNKTTWVTFVFWSSSWLNSLPRCKNFLARVNFQACLLHFKIQIAKCKKK